MPIVTKSEYATLRGWAPSYVSKLLRQGKIAELADGEHKGKIDSEDADRRLAEARDPSKDAVRRHWRDKKVGHPPDTLNLLPQVGGGAPKTSSDVPRSRSESGEDSYYAHKSKREKFEAQLAELRYLEEIGKLVAADDVEREIERLARSVRDAQLNIADRLAPILAAETDPARVHTLIAEEIRASHNELSRRLERGAAGDDAGGAAERPLAH